MSVEHLHYCKHGTHSETRTICPLILVLDQHIAIALCPYCCGWIQPRKSTSGTAGKLIPVLLTNLTQHLKDHYLGSLLRSSSFRFRLIFLPEVLSVLKSIEHLHHYKHGAHGGTTTICPLILISDQHIAVMLCPYCCRWIHPRKSTSGTTGKLIPVLLTNLTQYLKGYYLGSLLRSSSFRFHFPLLPEGCLCAGWYG